MKRTALIVGVALLATASYALGAAMTPPSLVDTYSTLADTILGAKNTEKNLVRSILDGHHVAASRAAEAGKWEDAAAEMSLFANEGDNAVGGIRKRLLEGGHHHNAEGEAQGVYEPGFVLVTKVQKQSVMEAVSALRAATTDDVRKAALAKFHSVAALVLATK